MNVTQTSNLELFLKHKKYVNELHAQQSNLNCIPFETEENKVFLNKINDKGFRTILKKEPASLTEEDYGQLVEFYYENLAEVYLSGKNIKIKKIHERTEQTPDFECSFSQKDGVEKKFYIEVKTLSFVGGPSEYRRCNEETFNAAVGIEQMIQDHPDQGVYTQLRELNNFGERLNNPNEQQKALIETFIDKINGCVKPMQFCNKPTFLLVFANRLYNGLLNKHDLVSYYFDKDLLAVSSGILWTVCFAEIRHLILKAPHIEGHSNLEGWLDKKGVIVDNNYIPGIIFVDSFCNKNMKVFGLYDEFWQSYNEQWGEADTNELFGKITDAFSGKRNERIYYELYKNLKDN